jgi:hypothetical protein
MSETTATEATKNKYALVIVHLINPNLVQGYPMSFGSVSEMEEYLLGCLTDGGGVVPILNADGSTLINVILGAGMTYHIEPWDAFEERIGEMRRQQEAMQKQQAQAAAAARLGVSLPNGDNVRRLK